MLAQLDTGQAEFAIDTMRAAGDLAASALASRARITRQLLQLDLSVPFFVVGRRRAQDDFLERRALGRVLLGAGLTMYVAHDHRCFCHDLTLRFSINRGFA